MALQFNPWVKNLWYNLTRGGARFTNTGKTTTWKPVFNNPNGSIISTSSNGYVSTSYLRENPNSYNRFTNPYSLTYRLNDGFGTVSNSVSSTLKDVLSGAGNFLSNIFNGDQPPTSGHSGSGRSTSSARFRPALSYIDAPLAQQYGLNRYTAYQEALANTAHQREILDLQKAGLNPVLSASGGSGASVISPTITASGGGSGGYGSSGKSHSIEGYGDVVSGVIDIISGDYGSGAKSVFRGISKIVSS